MPHATACPPALACPALPRRWRDGLLLWWTTPAPDPDAAHLAQAADHADLDRRLQRLARGRPDRFGPLPP